MFLPGVSPQWAYGRSIEWRFVEGAYDHPGPATVWARVAIPLIENRPTSPWQRMAIIADSTNGLSAELDPREWLFVPTGLTLTCGRYPQGEWLLLDPATLLSGDGRGTAHAWLSDNAGRLGSCSQPLLVDLRSAADRGSRSQGQAEPGRQTAAW